MQEPRRDRLKRAGMSMRCKRKDCFMYNFNSDRCTGLVYDRNGYGYDNDNPCPFFKTHLQQQAAVDAAQARQRKLFGHILDGPIGKLENEPADADDPLKDLAE